MPQDDISNLVHSLLQLTRETEWLELKHNNDDPEEIGEYISALANSAALHEKDAAYIVWGVEDDGHQVVGTDFKPREQKVGNEELENWLLRLLRPQAEFRLREGEFQGKWVVVFEIQPARDTPVRFKETEWIRVGSYKKKLKDHAEKERKLWRIFERETFEQGTAKAEVSGDEVLALLDFSACFDLLKITLPTDQSGILERLAQEEVIQRTMDGFFRITNLGAILFAKDLSAFPRLGRKSLRIIKYGGAGRTEMEREWRDAPSRKGYAISFEAAVAYINSQLPQNEPIGQALRQEVRMYPEKAIRELVANALVHQDLTITGAGPMVEIFNDRMEITNPGEPLVDTLRFIDAPPRSRNETLAAMMRRMGICEEGGTGIDKVIESVEVFQLPPPDFTTPSGFTRATLFAHRELNEMDQQQRVRACYQHACLMFVFGGKMTNASLRKRFGIEAKNSARASRIIADTVAEALIRPFDPETSKRYMKYVPFWA